MQGQGTTRPSTLIAHGGSLVQARRLFPGAPEPIIDLSTGINPVAYPIGVAIGHGEQLTGT